MKNDCRKRMLAITPRYNNIKARLTQILYQTFTVHKFKLYRLRDSPYTNDLVVLDAYLMIYPLSFGTKVIIQSRFSEVGRYIDYIIYPHFWVRPTNCNHEQSLRLFNGMIKMVERRAENYINQKEKNK